MRAPPYQGGGLTPPSPTPYFGGFIPLTPPAGVSLQVPPLAKLPPQRLEFRGVGKGGESSSRSHSPIEAFVVFILIISSPISACGSRSFCCWLRDLIWGGGEQLGDRGVGKGRPSPERSHLCNAPARLAFIIFIIPLLATFLARSVYIFLPSLYSWPFTGWQILVLSVWSVGGVEKYHWEFDSRIGLLFACFFCLRGGDREGLKMTRVAKMFFTSIA